MSPTSIKNDFTIGTDAELIITNYKNVMIYSKNYTPDGPMGADGNGRTWEVRSKPSRNPVELVSSIYSIFSNYLFTYPEFLDYNWNAGSFRSAHPIGLHVHFGIPKNKTNILEATKFLSNYVGAISLLIENPVEGKNRRASGDYGFYEDYREQPWGWEYRSMSSGLVSPYVTTALLCLAKVLIYEFQNNKQLSFSQHIKPGDFDQYITAELKQNFPKLWADIVKMKLYQQYKPYIDILHYLVTNNLSWYPKNKTMKEAWGLTDLTIPMGGVDMNAIWFKYNHKHKILEANYD